VRRRVRQRLWDREDEKDLKRAHVVLSQGHEVVEPGYSMMSSAVAMGKDKGRRRDNPNRVTWVKDKGRNPDTQTGLPRLAVVGSHRIGYPGQRQGPAIAG
jgi:hypothetical protein